MIRVSEMPEYFLMFTIYYDALKFREREAQRDPMYHGTKIPFDAFIILLKLKNEKMLKKVCFT